jgi:hypothetical protein
VRDEPGGKNYLICPADWVRGTVVREATTALPEATEASAARLEALYILGEDGTRVRSGTFDSELNIECAPVTATDGVLRCLPLYRASAVVNARSEAVYAGPACEELAAVYKPQCEGSEPGSHIVEVLGPGLCSPTLRVFERGESLMSIYVQGASCAVAAAGGPAYALGDEVDPSRFASMRVAPSPRIVSISNWNRGEQQQGWFDNELGTSCYPTAVPDGTMRCKPPTPRVGVAFTDPACRISVARFVVEE